MTQESIEEAISEIRDALRGLRFGQLVLFIQDGVLVQLDRTEKRRPTKAEKKP